MNKSELPSCDQVQHIVCLLLGEIGDALVCTPTLLALRRHYPKAHLELIARPAVVAMLEPGRLIDTFQVFDATNHIARLKFLWRLRHRPCDLWVDLQAPTFNTFGSDARIDRRNTLLRRIARSRFQRVFTSDPRSVKISHPVPAPQRAVLEQENIVDTTLRLIAEVPAAQKEKLKHLGISPEAQVWANDWWHSSGLTNATVLGLFFGAKQPAKFWPLEQVQSLIILWLDLHGQNSLVIFGAAHEEASTRVLLNSLPEAHRSRVISAVSACNLTQTAALMQRCDVMVCTDSGPMHMADALQCPLIALMSHHNHQGIWAPVSPNATVIAKQVACGPCYKDTCDRGNACMAQISAGEVLHAALEKLRSKSI